MLIFNKTRSGVIDASIAGAIVALIGVVLCLQIGKAQLAEMSWVRTKATVTSSDLSCHYSRGGESCNAYISYAYTTMDGYDYGSSNVEVLGGNIFSFGIRGQLNDRYPQGRLITVYYNPRNPARSSLGTADTPNPLIAFFMLILGLVMFLKGDSGGDAAPDNDKRLFPSGEVP